jgi:hypothetical protein
MCYETPSSFISLILIGLTVRNSKYWPRSSRSSLLTKCNVTVTSDLLITFHGAHSSTSVFAVFAVPHVCHVGINGLKQYLLWFYSQFLRFCLTSTHKQTWVIKQYESYLMWKQRTELSWATDELSSSLLSCVCLSPFSTFEPVGSFLRNLAWTLFYCRTLGNTVLCYFPHSVTTVWWTREIMKLTLLYAIMISYNWSRKHINIC